MSEVIVQVKLYKSFSYLNVFREELLVVAATLRCVQVHDSCFHVGQYPSVTIRVIAGHFEDQAPVVVVDYVKIPVGAGPVVDGLRLRSLADLVTPGVTGHQEDHGGDNALHLVTSCVTRTIC